MQRLPCAVSSVVLLFCAGNGCLCGGGLSQTLFQRRKCQRDRHCIQQRTERIQQCRIGGISQMHTVSGRVHFSQTAGGRVAYHGICVKVSDILSVQLLYRLCQGSVILLNACVAGEV